jgi:hypothetical protein
MAIALLLCRLTVRELKQGGFPGVRTISVGEETRPYMTAAASVFRVAFRLRM